MKNTFLRPNVISVTTDSCKILPLFDWDIFLVINTNPARYSGVTWMIATKDVTAESFNPCVFIANRLVKPRMRDSYEIQNCKSRLTKLLYCCKLLNCPNFNERIEIAFIWTWVFMNVPERIRVDLILSLKIK